MTAELVAGGVVELPAELAGLGLSEEQLAGAFELFRRMQAMESAKAAKLPAHATNERLIADWFAHNRADWSAETMTTRRSQITQLAAFLEPTPLLLATEDELLAFRDSRECGASALAGLVSCVRGFYHWVTVVRRLRADDPAAALQRPKVPKRRKSRRVAEPELQLVEEVAREDPQMRAWLLLLGHHGLRVSDVSRLNVEDITEDSSVAGIAG